MRKDSLKRSLHSASLLILSSAVILASGCSGLSKAPETARPWNTHLYDMARANWSDEEITPPLRLCWAKDISAPNVFTIYPREELSSPALSGGTVYVAGSGESLYSLDIRSGSINWRFDAGFPLEAPPTVSEGSVCLGSGEGVVTCLDSKTGDEIWRFQARSEVLSAPVIAGGMVYFYSADDRFHALHLKTGEKAWGYSRSTFRNVTARLRGSPAYSSEKGSLFQLFSDGFLVSLAADSGKELWAKRVFKDAQTVFSVRTTPLSSEGLVYMIDEAGSVISLDAGTGETKNVYNVIKARDFLLAGKRTLIIAGTDTVVALDRVSGAILWKREARYAPVASIFASGGSLFILSNHMKAPLGIKFLSSVDGAVEAVSLKDGSRLWEKGLHSTISSAGASSGGRVALFTDKGVLVVFSSR